ncbi:amidohydrolase family protein [Rhizobium miluonense]|jgi:5-methylthioadenosine/S-adenosylhomocysteine deaminase|uniref:5-methylthioadenosine/S-adenosylhomocysteine deaminase n=1 Tax=Rhizobium miluonense TaxID=411945 RepID=A0ABU1SX42_9HYPH|nr:amidohydrolase family protein [Rhizobium miluonense]MDR6903559.1 5-methylthioadenosine/S-adenosylhomocysteine deaminase [Rhizobium miluonense]
MHHHDQWTHFVIQSTEYFDLDRACFRLADIEIEGDVIVGIHPPGSASARHVVDGRKLLCTPGLVNAHLHPSKELYRGLYPPGSASEMLDVVHRNNRSESEADQASASMFALSQSILQGVTSVGIFTSRAKVDARQAQKSGLRAAVFFSQNDLWAGGGEIPETHKLDGILKQFDDVFDVFDDARISINPATASEFSSSDELLKVLHHIAMKTGRRFSLHIQEGAERVGAFIKTHGESGIARLSRVGVLDRFTTVVHASALTESDVRLLQAHPVGIVHCPISNAFTSAGKMPLRALVREHDVGIGTDSAMINPINRIAFEAAFAMHHHDASEDAARDIIEMLTIKGARSINIQNSGKIEPGMQADFCLFEGSPYKSPDHSIHFLELFLFGRPKSVFVAGKKVVNDYRLATGTEYDISRSYNESRDRIVSSVTA